MQVRVDVEQGTVIGGEGVLPNGKQYKFFKGIPYAVPPLGELRFKAPVRLEKFSTAEIDCTKEREVSYQKDDKKIVGSEDCLFLNIYTPQTESDQLMPVMVYIHGGQFLFGSGNSDLYNPLYLIQEGVVVVTINYRLGILGFLAFPEANIPGNAGLKDQRLALQWVQENILKFNGDPKNVTLFGESAGGACTHMHVLSQVSKQFFHKAIIQSGLATMPWAIDDIADPSERAKLLAQSLGCSSDDPFEILEFLQKISDLDKFIEPFLSETSLQVFFEGRPSPYRPVIEKQSADAVLTKESLSSMLVENSVDIPIMMGYTSAEGIVILQAIENLQDIEKILHLTIPKDLTPHLNDQKKSKILESIREFYFKGEAVQDKHIESVRDLLSDYFFTIDVNIAAEIHSKKQRNSPLFFYRFDYDGALNLYKKIFKRETVKGASHADELFYIFQAAIAPEPWEENAKKMVLKTCRLWTNFAKYGNPTPTVDGEIIDCVWERLRNISDNNKLALNACLIDKQLKMVNNPDQERLDFWRNIKQQFTDN